MQLHRIEACFVGDSENGFRRWFVHKNTNHLQRSVSVFASQTIDDLTRVSRFDETRAGAIEIKTQHVSAGFNGGARVGQTGDAADFYADFSRRVMSSVLGASLNEVSERRLRIAGAHKGLANQESFVASRSKLSHRFRI